MRLQVPGIGNACALISEVGILSSRRQTRCSMETVDFAVQMGEVLAEERLGAVEGFEA